MYNKYVLVIRITRHIYTDTHPHIHTLSLCLTPDSRLFSCIRMLKAHEAIDGSPSTYILLIKQLPNEIY